MSDEPYDLPDPEAQPVWLTPRQIRYLLDLLRFAAQLPWGRLRHDELRAVLRAGLDDDGPPA